MHDVQEIEDAAWSSAYGIATPQQTALLDADPEAWRVTLQRLVDRTDDLLEARPTPADDGDANGNGDATAAMLTGVRDQLRAALDDIDTSPRPPRRAPEPATEEEDAAEPPVPVEVDEGEPGTVELQASWSADRLVVWAGGRGAAPADHDELSDRLEAVGAPPHGWSPHRSVPLPSGAKAAALSIELADALGWLVTVGAGPTADAEGVGPSVRWLGRVSLAAVHLAAEGRVVPTLTASRRSGGRAADVSVSWAPALIDNDELSKLAARMPPTVGALDRADARAVAINVMERVVEVILGQAAKRVDLPAAPPNVRTAGDVSAAVLAKLDGTAFAAPVAPAT